MREMFLERETIRGCPQFKPGALLSGGVATERIGRHLTGSGYRFVVPGIPQGHMVGGISLIWEI